MSLDRESASNDGLAIDFRCPSFLRARQARYGKSCLGSARGRRRRPAGVAPNGKSPRGGAPVWGRYGEAPFRQGLRQRDICLLVMPNVSGSLVNSRRDRRHWRSLRLRGVVYMYLVRHELLRRRTTRNRMIKLIGAQASGNHANSEQKRRSSHEAFRDSHRPIFQRDLCQGRRQAVIVEGRYAHTGCDATTEDSQMLEVSKLTISPKNYELETAAAPHLKLASVPERLPNYGRPEMSEAMDSTNDQSSETIRGHGRFKLFMGYRADCDLCRSRTLGHYNHWLPI